MIQTFRAVRALVLLVLCAGPGLVSAQLSVSPQTDLQQLARAITGPGVTISNPQITCHAAGYGEFQYTGQLLGIEEGILLTTGSRANAVGPNDEENTTYQQHTSGDATLNIVTGRQTYDACKFEFDVIPMGDSLRFDFVFGSEEYNEWVGSQYNDVFGFFISGPGITGDPGIGNRKNIALVPGTNQAVTINNVNNGSNADHFHDNAGGQYLQYDGLTRGLSAFAQVQPCETYHLKLVVADASDRKFDSGVFIAKVESNPVTMELVSQSGSDTLIEGCNNGSVRFTRQLVTDQPLTLAYHLHGTATNGVDYAAIGDLDPNTVKLITIPANQASVDQPVSTIADGIAENAENLLFILGNPDCPGAYADTLIVPLVDSLHATLAPLQSTICPGDQVQLLATGGTAYAWTPSTGLSDAQVPNPIAQPAGTTTYTVEISEGACTRSLQAQVQVSAITATATITRPLCNGGTNGAINLAMSGGIPPYAFQWTGPNGFTATTEDIANIPAGNYNVTITDAACVQSMSFVVAQPPLLSVALEPSMLIFGQHISCHGGQDGSIDATVTGGTGPYTAQWTGPDGFTATTLDLANLGAGTYMLNVTDANGCSATANTTLLASAPMVATITETTAVSCANDANGSATVHISGGMPNYTYHWSTVPAQTGPTATGLTPGAYLVTATDQYGCEVDTLVTIDGPTQAISVQLMAKDDVACHGAADGSATLSVSGGTPGHTILWNTVPPQTGLAATDLAGGTYTATISDAHGCSTTFDVTIAEPAQPLSLAITAQQDVPCHGQASGSASVLATGGTGPYAYAWNTVPPRHGASQTGLHAGSYVVTVSDAQGCTATQTVEIDGPSSGLAASITSITDVGCAGTSTGEASVNVTGGTAPYSYLWNTTPAQTGPSATNLAAGTWAVTVHDAQGCSTSASATITTPSLLTISSTITPALCQGGANGAVDVLTSGGTPPYAWSWTGPSGYTATSEDITSLEAGGYVLTVTDAEGCSVTSSFDVNEPGLFTVSVTLSAYGAAQVSCPGSSDGSIDLSVSGAVPPYAITWSGPNGYSATTEDITGLPAGNYIAGIVDSNGCSTSVEVTLEAPASLAVQFSVSDHGGTAISCHGGSDGTISAAINGGTAPYSTLWSGPSGFSATGADLTGLFAGAYQLTITDAHGCTTTSTVGLSEPAVLAALDGGSSAVSCFGSNNGQATVHVTGGLAPYTYSWNSSPAQYAATATGLATGNYTVTVTDANGCATSTLMAVGGPTAPLAIGTSAITHVLCHGGQNGAATVEATGGTAPYSYAWATVPPSSGPTAAGLAAGTWTVVVTDAAGCSASRNITITQPQDPLSASVVHADPVTCFGDDDASLSIQVEGGSGHYSIIWDTTPVQTGSTITGLPAGNYTATITDLNGCAQALSFPVSVSGPSAPLAMTYEALTYPGGAHVSCPGLSDGSIDVSVTGGTPAYTYFWQDGLGGTFDMQDPSGLAAGSYFLTVGDGHGCHTDTVITLLPPTDISASATVQSAICHGASNGAITLSPAGGHPPYTFAWTGPDGFTSNSQHLSMIAAGVYSVTITDVNGCSSTQPFDVTEPGMFSFDASTEPPSCHDSANGSVQLSATGGTPPYTYAWSGPNGYSASTASISGLATGSYHLTLTDANGCSALYSTTLTAPDPITLFSISNKYHAGYDISCAGGTDGAIVSTFSGGTPPYTFAWTGPGGFTATTPDIAGLSAGTYTLTLTDANGCSRTTTTTLVAPPLLTATALPGVFPGGSNISCDGATDGSIVLTPSGGSGTYSVAWTGPSAYSSSTWQITGLAPGTYTATVTDGNGCTTTAQVTLTAPEPISLHTSSTDATCHAGTDGTIDLSVTGGSGTYTYQWTGPGAFVAASEDLLGLAAGTYEVIVTDANGCSAQASVTIIQPTPVQAIAAITTTACQGANTGAIDLTVSGGAGDYAFLWTGFPAFSATTEDIDNLFAGAYSVVITDDAGCTFSASYNVGEPGLFDIHADLSTMAGGYNVSCAAASDGTIDAVVSGGTAPYSYFWTGPGGFTSISLNLSGLASGTYNLTVHDANGCNATASFTLVAPPAISIGLVATTLPSCQGGSDGSIGTTISGGTAPYAYAWTGPNGPLGIAQNLTGIGAGTYMLTVTDALGCVATASITLTSPDGISAEATPFVFPNGAHVSCTGHSDGSIELVVTGGTSPYQVNWTGPTGFQASTADISGLAAGTYTATITDANGCTATTQVVLVAPDPIELSISTSAYSGGHEVSCFGATDGSIDLTISGGSPGYSTTWTGPGGFTSTAPILEQLAPGTYAVFVSDTAGCTATASVTLTAPPLITAAAVLSDHGGYEVGCNGDDGSITLTTAGGLAPYQYNWTGPNGFASNQQSLEDLVAGTYTVTITDANGCSINRSFVLNAPGNLVATLAVTSNACDTSENGEIMLTITGGGGPFTIAWTGPDGFTSTNTDISGLASGVYEVTVTSAAGCSTTAQAEVIAAAPMSLELYASDYGNVNIPCHGDSTGTIELTVAGGHLPLDVAWIGPGGSSSTSTTLNGLMAGTYSVTVTDAMGCPLDTTITLVEPEDPLITTLTATDITCFGELTGSISTVVSGGAAPYTFDWRGPDSTSFETQDLSDVAAGDYELVVIDANQCVNTATISIAEPDSALTVSLHAVEQDGYHTSCSDASDGAIDVAVAGGTPGYTYSWTGPDGFSSTEDSLSNVAAGTYVLTVLDAHGCTQVQTVTLVPPPPITIDLVAATFPSGSHISCADADDGTISATISGGSGSSVLLWSGPNGFSSTESSIDSLAPGTYCLTVTDANGCAAQACITLDAPTTLTVLASATDDACGLHAGTVSTQVSGGAAPYSYLWDTGEQDAQLTNRPAGTYSVVVTDANGCTANASATVGGGQAVTATATVDGLLCHDSADGAIALNITSGLAPFTIAWDHGSTDAELVDLAAGSYGVTVTDANGCVWDSLITVEAPLPLSADTVLSHYANGHHISTWNGTNGSIAVSPTGGTPPYAYAWNDGATTADRYGLSAGSYALRITDANGCSLELFFVLTQPSELEMPTGFTPNGDGQNDAFVVRGIDAYPENQLTVFNRWGNVVFDQLHYANEWRGENQQGQPLPDGTYFVVLRLNSDLTLQNYVDLRR